MTKEITTGYIVNGDNRPLTLYQNEGMKVLMFGRTDTVFSTRRAANKAIQDTIRYTRGKGYEWHKRTTIWRLTAPRSPRAKAAKK